MGVVTAFVARIWPSALIVAGGLALAWFLVVSPRLEVADVKAKKQQTVIDALKGNVEALQASKVEQDKVNTANTAELDRLANLKAVFDRQTIIVRESVTAAARAAGPQPIGAASRAYYDAIIAERAAEKAK